MEKQSSLKEKQDQKKLEAAKREKIINRLMIKFAEKSEENYYMSTDEVAQELKLMIDQKSNLDFEEYELVKQMSAKDIHVVLSYRKS